MSNLGLQILPPPENKIGWPWTHNAPPSQRRESDASLWPRISVVTPSYNQAEFLEQTIRSVLLQNYPNLEYIIIDGGSTDGSVSIIKKYQKFVNYWVSEKDGGQSCAINKGFSVATGEIFGWINSDDMLYPGSLAYVAQRFVRNIGPEWLIGGCEFWNEVNLFQNLYTPPNEVGFERTLLWVMNFFPQPAVFFNRNMWGLAGSLDPSLHYAMDFDLWLKMFKFNTPYTTQRVLAISRCQPKSKTYTSSIKLLRELSSIYRSIFKNDSLSPALKRRIKKELVERALRDAYFRIYDRKSAEGTECLYFAISNKPSCIFKRQTIKLVVMYILGKRTIDQIRKLIKSKYFNFFRSRQGEV